MVFWYGPLVRTILKRHPEQGPMLKIPSKMYTRPYYGPLKEIPWKKPESQSKGPQLEAHGTFSLLVVGLITPSRRVGLTYVMLGRGPMSRLISPTISSYHVSRELQQVDAVVAASQSLDAAKCPPKQPCLSCF